MPKGLVYRNCNYEFVENVEELDDNDYTYLLSNDDVLELVRSLVRRVVDLERELKDKAGIDFIADTLVRQQEWKNG